jgi:hypothetical protein
MAMIYALFLPIIQKMNVHQSTHHGVSTKKNFTSFISKKLTQTWQSNLCTFFRDRRYSLGTADLDIKDLDMGIHFVPSMQEGPPIRSFNCTLSNNFAEIILMCSKHKDRIY